MINKEEKAIYDKEYRDNNKEKISKHKKECHKKFPWKQILQSIKQRCNNPNNKDYKNYGGRGIKYNITEEDIEFLYYAYGADRMKKPTIDRVDNDKNYTLENCRFIELPENVAKDKRKIVLQFELDGSFIKEWKSQAEASRELGIFQGNICKVVSKERKTAGGYKWEYKNES